MSEVGMCSGIFFGCYMDEMGTGLLPINQQHKARTREQFPYGYSPILQFDAKNGKANETVYSDRLLQWDYEKHDAVSMDVFGNKSQFWSTRPAKKIQEFLRKYLGKDDLEIIRIIEYCNASNGFPCWRFDYFSPDSYKDQA